MIFGYSVGQIRKALVAAAGILTTLLTADLLPISWAQWVSTAAGILTLLATYQVPNAPATTVHRGAHEGPQTGASA